MLKLAQAIKSLAPDAQFKVRGSTTADIIWLDDTHPTDAEITAELTRLQAEFDSQQYARDRAEAYPSLTDQADMAYWDRKNGTTTLDDAITAVKSKHPKT